MNTPYTIEELIAELTSIAASRGWGAQSTTNIREIQSTSGNRQVKLLNGDEKDIEELERYLREESEQARSLDGQVTRLEKERDTLQDRVAFLTCEVRTLREEAGQ
jgi:uncharacterized sporulation protein YeaH/YhbH (DUF444 family)